MVRLIAHVIGVGVETADMLVHEVLARNLRDRRAVARYAGLTGSPDESGSRRRAAGERTRQGGKCRSTTRDDSVGLALPALSEGQRIGPVVSGANRDRWQKTQNNDRSFSTQVAHCLVALGDHWRNAGWRRVASLLTRRTEQALGA